jgi:cytosine/uracil/thiamine/allantoin permease
LLAPNSVGTSLLFVGLYSYVWFVGFGIAFVVYIILRWLRAATLAK